MKILVVEDNKAQADTLVRYLRQTLSHDPSCVQSAEIAKRLLEYDPRGFECAIVDLKLGDSISADLQVESDDGLHLILWMRQNGFDAPILVLTSHGEIEHLIAAYQAGATDFVRKGSDAALDLETKLEDGLSSNTLVETGERLGAGLRMYHDRVARGTIVVRGDLTLLEDENIVILRQRQLRPPLTQTEFKILFLLASSIRGRRWKNSVIGERCKPGEDPMTPNAVQQHITNIRKALGYDAIPNISGLYEFVEPPP